MLHEWDNFIHATYLIFLYSSCLATSMHLSMFGYKLKEADLAYVLIYVLVLWIHLSVSPSLSCRSCVPAGSQLCWENAGTDPGPAVQGVWGTGWSCARGTAAVWPLAGQTDGATNPPSQLPPPDKTAARTLMEITYRNWWKLPPSSLGSFMFEFKD